MTADGLYLYIAHHDNGQSKISQRLLTDISSVGDFTYEQWDTGTTIFNGFDGYDPVFATVNTPEGIVVIGDYVYASHASDGYNAGGVISRVHKTDLTLDSGFGGSTWGYYNPPGGLNSPKGLATDGTYLYIANSGANNILRMNADGTGITSFKESLTGLRGLSVSGGYLYATLANNTCVKILISDPAVMTTIVSSGLDVPLELAVSGADIFVANTSNSQRSNFPITMTGFIGKYGAGGGGGSPACFKEDTNILTDRGYVPVQDLKKGDLVQTLKHDYKPIHSVGKGQVLHTLASRTKDTLYKCTKEQYPEISEDLIMTASHAVLVFPFKEGEEEQAKKFYGRIFVTDKKYRLPVCLDKRATVYENEGTHTIYHIALEHDDIHMNYGIYANGLLVESCSRNDMKKFYRDV